MKIKLLLLFFFVAVNVFSQRDSLEVGDRYLEDQLYINVSYNLFGNKSNNKLGTGFSYGFSAGYIKDIPLQRNGRFAIGLGVGYSYDSFIHEFLIKEENGIHTFTIDSEKNNSFRLHNLEFPIQIRFRTSDVNKYSFWRIYSGITLAHYLMNKYAGPTTTIYNLPEFNSWQTAITLSVGYGTFNFYAYYSITPLFDQTTVNANIIKLGLSFYLL